MRLVEELDRQNRGQAAEDIEVIPLDDVPHGRGGDHAPKIFWDFRASHIVSSLCRGLVLKALSGGQSTHEIQARPPYPRANAMLHPIDCLSATRLRPKV